MWKSLFLPIEEGDRAVYASNFDPKPRPCNLSTCLSQDPQQAPRAAETILTVLESQDIVMYSLDSQAKGPYVKSRIRAPAAMKEAPGSKRATSERAPDSKSRVKATCGTLFPFLIPTPDRPADMRNHPINETPAPSETGSMASIPRCVGNIQEATPVSLKSSKYTDPHHHDDTCPVASDGREQVEIEAGGVKVRATLPPPVTELKNKVQTALNKFTPANRSDSDDEGMFGAARERDDDAIPLPPRQPLNDDQYDRWVATKLMRGAVGSSNGRIDIFTADKYVMGFPAHDCPVVGIRGIVNEADPEGLTVVKKGSKSSGKRATSSKVPRDASEAQRATMYVTERLSFVTHGADGSIFVWRRSQDIDGYTRTIHFKASLLKSIGAFDAHSGVVICPGPTFSTAIQVRTPNGDLVEKEVMLQGTFEKTNAIALDGHYCLAARGNVIYGIDYLTKMVHRLLTTDSVVTHLTLTMPYGVAGCANGRLVFFSAEDGVILSGSGSSRKRAPSRAAWRDPAFREEAQAKAATAVAVGTSGSVFCTFGASTVQSLTVHRRAMLSIVVDKDAGAVEVVQLPEEFLRCMGHNPPGRVLAQANVLGKLIALDEVAGNKHAEGNLVEAVLLARYMVPDELKEYCGRSTRMV